MNHEIVLTDLQEQGLLVKVQEENVRRLRPVLVGGKPTKLPQITPGEYLQAVVEDIAQQGVKQLEQLEEAEFSQKIKRLLKDPEARKLVEKALKENKAL